MWGVYNLMFAPGVADSERQEGRSFSFCPTASPPFKSHKDKYLSKTITIPITLTILITKTISKTITITKTITIEY